jgi:hypothetical protein
MTTDQLTIDAALAAWRQAAAQASETFNSLTDDQFQREVAPGRKSHPLPLGPSDCRNRLNILLSRARQVSYHLGQVALARNEQRAQTSRPETKNYA